MPRHKFRHPAFRNALPPPLNGIRYHLWNVYAQQIFCLAHFVRPSALPSIPSLPSLLALSLRDSDGPLKLDTDRIGGGKKEKTSDSGRLRVGL